MMVHAVQEIAKRSLLDISEMSSHLEALGYPRKALKLVKTCGFGFGLKIIKSCGCGVEVLEVAESCNKSFCPMCSKKRKKRIRRRLFPLLKYYKNNPLYKWRFLTISPENYDNYDEGLKDIRKSFNKFIRRKYIRERVKGGFYIIEVTDKGEGWNFHIHAIIYSRYLDNVHRAYCGHCKQGYLKRDWINKKFYCANRKCSKLYEGVINPSRLRREFIDSSGRDCYFHVTNQSPSNVLNYMLKYVTEVKDSFSSVESFAFHVCKSYKRMLINSFGEFYDYKNKILKNHPFMTPKMKCLRCGVVPYYCLDYEVIHYFLREKPPPNPQRVL